MRSTPDAQLPSALSWERLLLDKAVAAGSAPALVYNTKHSGAAGGPDAAAVAAAVPRLAAVLNPGGAIASTQLELAREEASDPLAAFLQAVAAQARQGDAPRSLPEQYLSADAMVFLNIPMDAETPTMRLLRPQARASAAASARACLLLALAPPAVKSSSPL